MSGCFSAYDTVFITITTHRRCTLVTTVQMFKILALNSLLLSYRYVHAVVTKIPHVQATNISYSLSVLYLNGVKQGDTQVCAVKQCNY